MDEQRLHIYQSSTLEELRDFWLARQSNPQIPSSWMYRRQFIERLQLLDREATFDFMALPPELRKEVYRELLLRRSSKPGSNQRASVRQIKCFPNIMQVSKQVHAEASEVLYGERKFVISIRQTYHSPSSNEPRSDCTMIFSDPFTCRYPAASSSRDHVLWHPPHFPDILLRVQSLEITVNLAIYASTPYPADLARSLMYEGMNHLLYTLGSFMTKNKQLKQLLIQVETHQHSMALHNILDKILWPLVKFPGPRNTTIQGVPEDVAEYIVAVMQEPEHQTSSVYGAQKLRISAQSLARYVKKVGVSTLAGRKWREAASALEHILKAPGYVDAHQDAWLTRTVERYNHECSGTAINEVQNSLEKIIEANEELLEDFTADLPMMIIDENESVLETRKDKKECVSGCTTESSKMCRVCLDDALEEMSLMSDTVLDEIDNE